MTASSPSLLVVTTVAGTMGFLTPYVRHFRERGWRVDGAARGISTDRQALAAFDAVHEVPLSRSIRDVRRLAASTAAKLSMPTLEPSIAHDSYSGPSTTVPAYFPFLTRQMLLQHMEQEKQALSPIL